MATRISPLPPAPVSLGWRNPPFLILLVAQFISLVGTQVTFVALPWFVLSRTNSPGLMTIVLIAESLPMALFGIPAGTLVDRFNKKWLMIVFDLSRGVVVLCIPLLALAGGLQFWMIVVVSFFNGLLNTPYSGARMALIPALVGEDTTELTRANTMFQFIMQFTGILGPALAGILIAALGNVNVLFLDSASFILAGLLIAFGVRYKREVQDSEKKDEHWFEEFQVGLRFIWEHKTIRTIIAIGMFATLGYVVLSTAILPVFVKEVLQADAHILGGLLSMLGIGSIAGMALYGGLANRWPWKQGETILYFSIGMAVPLWIIPLWPSFIPTLIALGLTAFFATPIVIIIYTSLQKRTPKELRGRVFSTFNALWLMVTPFGLIVAGPLLEKFGVMTVIWLVVLLITACPVAAWMSPSVRHI